jgi:ankyrin repeat protein
MPVSPVPQGSASMPLRKIKSAPDFKTDPDPGHGALRRRSSAPEQLQPRSSSKTQSAERLEVFKQLRLKRAGLPYTPSKGDSTVNLNGLVDLPNEIPDSANNTTVWCRHLTTLFVLQQGKKRLLVEQLRTREGIEATFKGKLASVNAVYASMLRAAAQHSKHLVNEQQFGTYVGAVAQALATKAPSGSPANANVFLLSAEHVMALHVERKTKDGQTSYNAKVFDPNWHGNYRRDPINVPTPQALAHLQFKDFLIEPEFAAAYAPSNAPLTLSAVCVEDTLNLHLPQLHFCPLDQQNNIPTASHLYLVLRSGMHEGLAAMAQSLTEHAAQLPEGKLLELLAAKSSDGMPGLHMAIINGHVQTLQCFADMLGKLAIPMEDRISLMAAKNDKGVPGLYMAMANGEAQTLQCLADMLEELAIPMADQVKLLAAKTDDGCPGLSAALVNGDAQTVRCFGRILTKRAIPMEDRISLMAAKTDAGLCSLHSAIEHDHVDAIRAFIQAIDQPGFSDAAKMELLSAKGANGISALYMAIVRGKTEVIAAFTEEIKALGLDKEQLFDLIAAKDPNNVSAVITALKIGQYESALAGIEMFTALEINPQKVADLLESHKHDVK